jgi:hypothetical protein
MGREREGEKTETKVKRGREQRGGGFVYDCIAVQCACCFWNLRIFGFRDKIEAVGW